MNNMARMGTVIKVTERHIVLLLEDGTFFNVQRKADDIPLIGTSYEYRPQILPSSYRMMIKYGSLAATFLLAIMIFTLLNSKSSDAYLVAVDINPSLEIYVSSDELVNSIVPLNQDAERLLKDMDYKKKPIMSVMANVISHSTEMGYIQKDGSSVIELTVVKLNDNNKDILESINQTVMNHIILNNIVAKVRISTADKQALELAHEQKISINDAVNKQGNDHNEQISETTVEQLEDEPGQAPVYKAPEMDDQQETLQIPVKKQNIKPSPASTPSEIERTNSVDLPKENNKSIENKGNHTPEKAPISKQEPHDKQPTKTEQPKKVEQPTGTEQSSKVEQSSKPAQPTKPEQSQSVPDSSAQQREGVINNSEPADELNPEDPLPQEAPGVVEQSIDSSQSDVLPTNPSKQNEQIHSTSLDIE